MIKIKGRFQIRSLFAKLFISYALLISICTIAITILLFNIFSGNSIKQIKEIAQKNLIQSSNSIEFIMQQAKLTCLQLSLDNEVSRFLNSKAVDPYLTGSILLKMQNLRFINNSISSICLYNGVNNNFLTTAYPFTEEKTIEWLSAKNIKNFYQVVPRYLEINNTDDKIQRIYSVFYCNKSINNKIIDNAIIVNIDMETVIKDAGSLGTEGNKLLILDKKGVAVFSSNKDDFLKDFSGTNYVRKIINMNENGSLVDFVDYKKTLMNYTYSPELDWYFLYIIPYEKATADISVIQFSTIIICIILMILSLIAAAIFSGKISSPFAAIARKVAGLPVARDYQLEGKISEQEILSRFYSNLIKEADKYESLYRDTQRGFVCDYLWDLLLGVKVPKKEDMEVFKTGLDVFGVISVVFIQLDKVIDIGNRDTNNNSDELEQKIVRFLSSFSKDFLQNYFPCEVVEMDYAVVMLLNDGESTHGENVEEVLSKLQNQFYTTYGTSITISIGLATNEVHSISEAYESAKETSLYKIVYGEGKILRYRDVMKNICLEFDYPYNKEKNLLELIKSGKESRIEAAVEDIFDSFKSFHYSSIIMSVNHLLFSVFTTNEMLMNSAMPAMFEGFNKTLEKVQKLETLNQIKTWFINYINYSIQVLMESKKNTKSDLARQIGDFVEKNFFNPDLSIEVVAGKFSYNPIYFGRLFKELFGKAFLDYLSEIRLNKANAYLMEHRFTIKEVGEKVGFINYPYFVTWYKKNTGYAPGDYRKMNQKSND